MALLLRRIDAIVPSRAGDVGGKARNLATLARAGFPVPKGYVLGADLCDRFLRELLQESERLPALLGAVEAPTDAQVHAIAARIRSTPLDRRISKALGEAFTSLRRDGAVAVAVRSSSTREDGDETSAAGLHTTLLNVRTEAAVMDAVKACWASLFTPRAISYLRLHRGAGAPSMGVVVQAMVPAEVSGVLFTVNPLTSDPHEMVINAAYGLGAAVVDGRVTPDTWRIDKPSGALRDVLAGEKTVRDVLDEPLGVREEAVPDEERSRLSLDETAVDELVRLGLRIERHFDDPRDVEWALADGRLYVLQARPITTLAAAARRPRRQRSASYERSKIVWSNANVGEALPGVATPLTWSVLSNFSDLGFRRAFGSLGCSVPKDAELVGNFRGRIYLNLSELTSIASQVPGLSPRTLLSLGGGGEVETLEIAQEKRGHSVFFLRLPWTISRYVRDNIGLAARVESFEAEFREERGRFYGLDLRLLSPIALERTLRGLEHLLDHSGAIMLTCYGHLLMSVVLLRTILSVVVPERAGTFERNLLSGLAEVESAAPGISLRHIAEIVRVEPAVRDLVLGTDPGTLRVERLPDGAAARALRAFLQTYGHRGPREAELFEPRWREDPSLLFAALQAHLRNAPLSARPVDVEAKQRAIRERATTELFEALPPLAAIPVRRLLAHVSRFMRLRERLRAHVTDVLGMFRRVALDASRRIERREIDAGRDAAFFLTLEEVHAVLRGDLMRVSSRIGKRRRQYERDRAAPDPPDTFIGFPPPADAIEPSSDALRGLPASGGIVEGNARVLASAAQAGELEPGEILVAPYADVGWSPLFLVARGVVTDLGGPLSHAAIVLREYGVPAVVNVKSGSRVIRTGDLLRVDGDAGTVHILRSATPVESPTHADA